MHALRSRATAAAVVAACVLGERASLRMLRKSIRDARHELDEDSVVRLPEAKLFFGIPNSALGVPFYAFVMASQVAPPPARGPLRRLAAAASVAAALTSAYLGASLLRQRRECVNCWTAHAVNASLLALLLVQNRPHRAEPDPAP